MQKIIQNDTLKVSSLEEEEVGFQKAIILDHFPIQEKRFHGFYTHPYPSKGGE